MHATQTTKRTIVINRNNENRMFSFAERARIVSIVYELRPLTLVLEFQATYLLGIIGVNRGNRG